MLCPKDLRSGSAYICWGRCFLHLAMLKRLPSLIHSLESLHFLLNVTHYYRNE